MILLKNTTFIDWKTLEIKHTDILVEEGKDGAIKFADNVIMLQTDATPYVLLKLFSDEVSKIQLGAPCIIYSARLKKRFNAHVSGIGYPALDGIRVGANELSQNEIPVKISFNDADVNFSLNEYVNVYITNTSFLSQKILSLFLNN